MIFSGKISKQLITVMNFILQNYVDLILSGTNIFLNIWLYLNFSISENRTNKHSKILILINASLDLINKHCKLNYFGSMLL